MKLKSKFAKYIFTSLKSDFSRIIAVILIVGLANSFLIGLLSTTPDLFKAMDSYYDESRFMDVSIRSTVGFDKETLSYVDENISDIQSIDITSEQEQYITIDGVRSYAQITYRSLDSDSTNYLTLVSGRYPTNENECLILEAKASSSDFKLNSKIVIDDKQYNAVGIVKNPMYVTYQSETSLTSGMSIESFIYLDDKYVDDLTYTNMYISFNQAKKYDSFSDRYDDYIEKKVEDLQDISKKALQIRVDSLSESIKEEARDEVELAIKNEIIAQVKEEYGIDITIEIIDAYLASNDDLRATYEEEVEKALQEVVDEQISSLSPTWYVLDRDSVTSAYLFKTDALKMQTISLIFPPFFFLIAMLVCLASMSRIITRDRTYIGTLKALGFSKRKISLKYILYGLVSSLIGCIGGAIIGIFAIPTAIMMIYSSVYYIHALTFTFQSLYVFGFSALMIVLLLAVVIGVILSNLREPAAQLMLGNKSPKPGKKILLERIPFLWKHIKFKYKSMFRNIFRFKKNLLMMIIGVGGCTGMLLTSFGLQDSFNVIKNDQYNTIIKYDALLTINENNYDLKNEFDNLFIDVNYITTNYQRVTLKEDEAYNIQLIATNENLNDFVGLFDNNNDPIVFDENSIIISKQLSNNFDIDKNDSIIINTDFGEKTLSVSDVCINYIDNYIFMGEIVYNELFNNEETSNFIYNSYLIDFISNNQDDIGAAIDYLSNLDVVSSVSSTTSTRQMYDSIIDNLSMIVILIVILSGALAAIVIYNLTDININERIREIATLRVLGYRRREVLMYILREIFVMATIGIAIGLGIGVFLHWFIVINIESVGILFSLTISWQSYIYAILIAWVFVIAVTMCFYPRIRKINMAESLKSVD